MQPEGFSPCGFAALTTLLLALERRRIAHPKAEDYADFQSGITAEICDWRNGVHRYSFQRTAHHNLPPEYLELVSREPVFRPGPRARSEEKKRKRDEKTALRKAQRAEAPAGAKR